MSVKGRRRPYTTLGLRRVACARCGEKPAAFQWSACANGGRYAAVCARCDVELNRIVLRFFRFPDWRAMHRAYAARVEADRTG